MICTKCHEDKPQSEFSPKGDRLNTHCKMCMNRYAREHYRRNSQWRDRRKSAVADNVKRRRHKLRDMVDRIKSVPCKDCGNTHNPFVMDFHHRLDEDKLKEVSVMVSQGYGIDKIMREIEKCDILCANCHRMRHLPM